MKMLRILRRNNGLLLTGALIQQAQSGAEKLKTTGENSARDRVKEPENTERNKTSHLVGNVKEEEISKFMNVNKEVDSSTSGWDRVKKAFCYDELRRPTPELYFTLHLAGIGCIGGYIVGGFREYAKAVYYYLYTKDTNKYLNVKEAKRSLAKYSLKSFIFGGVLAAPKTGILCGIFGASYTAMSAYRGKHGILEFTFAGAVTTALMKWNLGIRGMISGCITGGMAGLIYGCIITSLLSLTGNSVSDIQQFLFNYKNMKDKYIFENEREDRMSNVEKYYHKKSEDLPVAFSDSS